MSDNPILRHKTRTLCLALALLAAGSLVYIYRGHLDIETLIEFGEDLPAILVLPAFLVLPLLGVSFRLLLILVGVRFGFFWGSVVAGFGILFHNIAAYSITRGTFREPVRRYLIKKGYATPSIPEKHQIWLTAAVAAVPGPPYFAKLYLLALTDLPFRIYVGIGTPIYLLISFVSIGIGSAVTDFDPKWAYILSAIFVLTVIIGYWLKKKYAPGQLFKHKAL